jgi:hypothetical protein
VAAQRPFGPYKNSHADAKIRAGYALSPDFIFLLSASMNPSDDRRNTSPGRRLGTDRRSATDAHYSGPERRDGGERRYGASRRRAPVG